VALVNATSLMASPPARAARDHEGWHALFFPEAFEHSLTLHTGVGWALSPWAAVQQTACDALAKLEHDDVPPRDWTLTDESPP